MLSGVSAEVVIYCVLWFFVLLVPIFDEYYNYQAGFTSGFDWHTVFRGYLVALPFLIIFLLGKLIYEPKLFFRGRHTAFFFASFMTALVLILASGVIPPRGYNIDDPAPMIGPVFARLIMALFMQGSSLALAVFFRMRQAKLLDHEQQAAHLQSELDYLKYQINPHFFMNTLNNIHALVDIDSELAKQAIIELSHLMRYILYETNQPTVPLRRELAFVRNFFELMKLRFDESVALTYEEPDPTAKGLEASIPPLLLLTFIENAFKHGISHREPSFIDIKVSFEEKQLHFHCSNSNFSTVGKHDQQGGVGLENIKKRLQLIYQNNYTLNIVPDDRVFSVDLWVPCHQCFSLPEDPSEPI